MAGPAPRTAARRRALAGAAALFAAFLGLYAALSGDRLLRQSQAPHFVYQAMAFLQGRLDVHVDLPNGNDWARAPDGRVHVSFPPGPAVLMLPLAASYGYQVNDVAFAVTAAALAPALLFLLLRLLASRGESSRGPREDALLAVLFGAGTVFLPCAVRGEVWFTAHVVAASATIVFLGAAHRLAHPALAGLAWSFAAVTRTPLLFAGLYFALELVAPDGRLDLAALRDDRARRLRALAAFAAPAAVVLGAAAAFNAARFGDPLEFGHRFLHENRVGPDLEAHGLFSLAYLPRNLEAALLLLPKVRSIWPPALDFDPRGMSVLVTTPLLVLLAVPKDGARLYRLLVPTAAAVAAPALLYMNTGYVQFGYRFSLDWLPLAFVLLAAGGRRLGPIPLSLGAAGVAVNVWGALAFR